MKRKYTIITLLIFVASIFTSMPAFANTTSSELEEVYDVGGNRIYLNDPEPTEEEL